jgi:hypothetical protein
VDYIDSRLYNDIRTVEDQCSCCFPPSVVLEMVDLLARIGHATGQHADHCQAPYNDRFSLAESRALEYDTHLLEDRLGRAAGQLGKTAAALAGVQQCWFEGKEATAVLKKMLRKFHLTDFEEQAREGFQAELRELEESA